MESYITSISGCRVWLCVDAKFRTEFTNITAKLGHSYEQKRPEGFTCETLLKRCVALVHWSIIFVWSVTLGSEKLKLMRNWKSWEREPMLQCIKGRVGMVFAWLQSACHQPVDCLWMVASTTWLWHWKKSDWSMKREHPVQPSEKVSNIYSMYSP